MATVAAPAPAVTATRVVGLTVVAAAATLSCVVATDAVAVEPCEDRGEEEEDAVHDAEGKASLEKGACLVGVDAEAIAVELAENTEVEVVGGARGDMGAVGAGDEAEVVDARNESADEACSIGKMSMLAMWLVPWLRESREVGDRGGLGERIWEAGERGGRMHTQIDERNESRVRATPVIGEEGEYGPRQSQYRYYE